MGIHHFASITIIAYILLLYLKVSLAVDLISQSQSIRDDGVTLVSESGTFELGFFSPGNSNKRYLGIWYKNIPIQTVVWVASRNNPINDSTGVWSTTSVKNPQNPVANLLDYGNLVVREEKEANLETYLWQSFDYPTDTFLPGMKFGWDLRTGLNRRLVAWKSPDDPSTGDFSWGMVLNNYPDAYMMKGTHKFYRAGPWNGLRPSGSPQIKANPIYDYEFVSNRDEIYFMYQLNNNSAISRQVLNITTQACQRFVWIEAQQGWRLYQTVPLDYCDTYALCGVFGICTISGSPVCQCLKGFSPKSPKKWTYMDWSEGCVRNKPLSCKDGFVKMSNLKLPDTAHTWLDETITLEECRNKCLNNCSCMAYTNSDIRGLGSGCAMWFGDLIDIRQFSDGGQDLYVRMAASELGEVRGSKRKLTIMVFSTLGAISAMLLLSFCCYIYYDRRKKKEKSENKEDQNEGGRVDDLDLPLLDFSTVAIATNNFSEENKIGEGGFGPVYKGILAHGQEIAVKTLSKRSGQGMTEFKNEVKLIVKLQHRNLVKLLGCGIEGKDKMLVYEYMPNGSLDYFIFDDAKGKVLHWPKRFNIICGIARGLLYLHQDSRLRVIHRDLKPSNVLIDDNLNPKISDFGIAKIFGGDQAEGNTKRVMGTYGYIAPEYAADGHFSIKSDVFSFGIIVLEIISGKRSRGFYHPDQSLNLISHGVHPFGKIGTASLLTNQDSIALGSTQAWSLWKEGRDFELINSNIKDCILSEVQRCIHIGLLCVQQYPEDRPTMSSVVLMLGSETKLAQPKEPAFYTKKDAIEPNFFSGQMDSTNEATITLPEAR